MTFSIKPFLRDDAASIGLMTAAGTGLLLGACALGVDMGMVYLAKRDLQNAADAAAIVAVDSYETGAMAGITELFEKRGSEDVSVKTIEPGRYLRLGEVDLADRFVPDEEAPTAARVTVTRDVPLYFAKVFSGSDTFRVEAVATAARLDRAAFQVGARLGSLSGGVPNALLSALAGDDLQLTIDDFSDLEGTAIDLLDFADAVRARAGLGNATYGEVFANDTPLPDVVEALADAAANESTRTLLMGVASKLGSETVTLADMIDLGPYAQTDFNDGTGAVTVDAASLMRGAIEYSHGDGYDVETTLSVAGASTTKARLVGGNVIATSPLMTVTDSDEVVLRTGRIRLYLETTMPTSASGLASLKVPLYVELASAEAKLSDIECSSETGGVTLAVTPSIGTVAFASANSSELGDLTAEPTLSDATIASITGIKVRGYSAIELGGTTAKSVFFSKSEIAAKTTKSVATDDLITGVATSLVEDLELSVDAGPLVLTPTELIEGQVAAALLTLAPALDSVINSATRTMGVSLGLADTKVNAMRCGMPSLVA